MRIASYRHAGRDGFGAVVGDAIVDFTGRWPTLRAALAAGALDAMREMAEGPATIPLAAAELAIPVPDAGKIIAIGMNYAAHIEEMGQKPPTHPNLFARFADSLVGHGRPIVRPRVSDQLDWEGELAVFIGRGGRHIAEADALAHVAGYTCFNEGSVRDWQFRVQQTLAGKNFFASGACGPWLATADEVGDPGSLTLTSRVNGVVMQHAATSDLVFGVPALIAYISTFTPLAPGDIVVTGNPSGSGFIRKPPVWLKPGDTVEVEIDRIGTLRNPVVSE